MSHVAKNMKRTLAGTLCVLLLASSIPQKTEAGIIEYSDLLLYVALTVITLLPQGSHVVLQQLQSAVDGAQLAHADGNQRQELSKLSQAIGAAQALAGMTSSCDACGDVRDNLQIVIGIATGLRARVMGTSRTCNPNGIIGPNEQCDPLANPTGCPNDLTFPTFCDDVCQCEAVVIP